MPRGRPETSPTYCGWRRLRQRAAPASTPSRPSVPRGPAADQRQVFAEFRPVEVEQHGAVAHLLLRHLVEDLGGGRIFRAQPFGKAAIDAAVLVLVGDGKREDFLFGELGKALHGALQHRRFSYIRNSSRQQTRAFDKSDAIGPLGGGDSSMKRLSLSGTR